MPITGRKRGECFRYFRKHLGDLVAATLTKTHQLHYDSKDDLRTLCFREGDQITIPLKTKENGTLHFSLAQSLEEVREKGKYVLMTRQYWYRVQKNPGLKEHAILRWEYDPKQHPPKDKSSCMHHLHLDAEFLGRHLNEIHVPTGWVLIEDVIRFLITELGVQPPCGSQNWPGLLHRSAKRFFREFCPRGPKQ